MENPNKTLPQNEVDDYVTTHITPTFMPFLDKDTKSALWGSDGNLIIATNKLVQSIGFIDYRQMLGLSIKN